MVPFSVRSPTFFQQIGGGLMAGSRNVSSSSLEQQLVLQHQELRSLFHVSPAPCKDQRLQFSARNSSFPASNHIKSFAQASYFTFSVAQGVLIEKSALCSHILHQEQGCRAELSPQHQSSNQLNPTDQTDHLDIDGSCNQLSAHWSQKIPTH